MKTEKPITLQSNYKKIQLYCAPQTAPLVIYHAVRGEGSSLWKTCQKLNCPDFSLAVINDVDWNDEMSPWPIPPISKGDTPCSGGADAYLEKFTNDMMPQITASLPTPPQYYALAGYSLAGLFSLYAAYKTDCFSRIASASGSMWYPDFVPFVNQNHISDESKIIYYYLGD
ncbi:MAG: alpha/beta hydrolase [Clostridiales bacterium]|nr:alpha/beta hydrolase [Clostridiales bacterium]